MVVPPRPKSPVRVFSGGPNASLYNVDAAAHLPDRTQGRFQFVVSAPRPNCVDRSHSCRIHFCWMPKRAAPQPSPTPAAAPTTTAAIPTPMPQGAAEPSQTAEAYRRGSSTTHSYSNAYPSISHAGPITHGCGRSYSEPNSGSYSGVDARVWSHTRQALSMSSRGSASSRRTSISSPRASPALIMQPGVLLGRRSKWTIAPPTVVNRSPQWKHTQPSGGIL